MRLRLAVLLGIMSLYALAQRGGTMPAGHGGGGGRWGNVSPLPFPGSGGYPWGGRGWWGGKHQPGIGPFPGYGFGAGAFDTPLCASPLFPLAPSCSFGDAFDPGYYQPQPMDPGPPPNVVVIPAPPPALPPAPNTIGLAVDRLPNPPQTTAAPNPPVRSPVALEESPPIIVLKTGGMYSITRYWVKSKNIYFETTSHDVLYAPLTSLDRMIPGSKPLTATSAK
jgi:hypothetical protein